MIEPILAGKLVARINFRQRLPLQIGVRCEYRLRGANGRGKRKRCGCSHNGEELIEVAARWSDPRDRLGNGLQPYGRTAEQKSLDLLEAALLLPKATIAEPVLERLRSSISQDVMELTPFLEQRCTSALNDAERKLRARATIESESMTRLLEDQGHRIRETQARYDDPQQSFGFGDDEGRQLQVNKRYWNCFCGRGAAFVTPRGPRRLIP